MAAIAIATAPVTPNSTAPITNTGLTETEASVASFAANLTPPVKENFHIYLLMCQSNMVGRDTRGLATPNNPRLLSLNSDPHAGFADSKGLGHKGDGLHFSAEAEKEMGVRFAQAMQQQK